MYSTWGSPSGLSSWVSSNDPCDGSWAGVSCTSDIVTILDVGRISLQHAVDPALGDLTGLQALDMSGCGITGTLPATMTALSSLSWCLLYWNAFSGSIPPWLSVLTALRTLHLYGNDLQGSLPQQLSYLTSFSVVNNAALCGSSASFPGMDTTGTLLGQACPPSRECKWHKPETMR